MKYNLAWLIQQYENNRDVSFLFFWGHRPSKENRLTKSCLSQWWMASFEVEGSVYFTAEHWMMAAKARLFGDEEMTRQIIQTPDPNAAKKLGRKVKAFDAEIWDAHKFDIVVEGNFHKFSAHAVLKNFLLATGNKVLAEASPEDTIWGIGLTQEDPCVYDPTKWLGENLLGFALMQVRDQLLKAQI